jgi:phage terminase large subunit
MFLVEEYPPGVPGVFRPRGAAVDLWKSRAREIMLSGPAETGKTFACCHKLDALLWKYPGAQAVMVRKTLATLYTTVYQTLRKVLGPETPVDFYGGDKKPEWLDYPNGSRVYFASMDNAGKALSSERDYIYVNQAEELAIEDWETLTTRCTGRAGNTPYPQIFGDCNPGAPTHWIKGRESLAMLESRHEDNPTLYDDDGNMTEQGRLTIATLDALTGVRYLRLRKGLWAAAEGIWFEDFDPAIHVTDRAEFNPVLSTFLAVDPGVTTGAVLFQCHVATGRMQVNVYADYLSENRGAQADAAALIDLCRRLSQGRNPRQSYCDPAGRARTSIGPTVLDEYARAGLFLNPWAYANPRVADSLENLASLIKPLSGAPRLHVHPRCRNLIEAFGSYRRKKRAGQWLDEPEDPQHPAEDLIDALRGGLWARRHNAVERIFAN